MARVTIEDCLVHIPNPFQIVMLAADMSCRWRKEFGFSRQGDTPPVAALRAIASGITDPTAYIESARLRMNAEQKTTHGEA